MLYYEIISTTSLVIYKTFLRRKVLHLRERNAPFRKQIYLFGFFVCFAGISKMTPNLPACGAFKLPIKYFFPTPLSPQERLCFSLFPKIVPFNQSAVTFIADVNLQSGNSFCLFAWGSGIPPPPQPLWKNHCFSLKWFFLRCFGSFFTISPGQGKGTFCKGQVGAVCIGKSHREKKKTYTNPRDCCPGGAERAADLPWS